MDAVAAAALAAIVDHDCARVLQDVIAENAALRQQLQDFQAKLRGQADIIVKLRHTINDLCEDSPGFYQDSQEFLGTATASGISGVSSWVLPPFT